MERRPHLTAPLILQGHRPSAQALSASGPSRTSHTRTQQRLIGQDSPDLSSSPLPKLPLEPLARRPRSSPTCPMIHSCARQGAAETPYPRRPSALAQRRKVAAGQVHGVPSSMTLRSDHERVQKASVREHSPSSTRMWSLRNPSRHLGDNLRIPGCKTKRSMTGYSKPQQQLSRAQVKPPHDNRLATGGESGERRGPT